MYYNDNEKITREPSKNTFTLYSKIFRLLLTKSSKSSNSREEELEKLVLPSNEQWRQKVYYNLVELQRSIDVEAKKRKTMECQEEVQDIFKEQWDPRGKLSLVMSHKQKSSNDQRTSISINKEPKWTLSDILLAAKVLEKNSSVTYENEAQMRRVYSLVYDVLRYKRILYQALDDVNFWQHYATLKMREQIVLLLFYDMHARKPIKLTEISKEAERQKALTDAGLIDVEEALLQSKSSLTASLARLRINGQALHFDDLLPRHLRSSESIAATSGWVNTLKIPNQRDLINEMSKLGFSVCYESSISDLTETQYNFDPLCPKVVNFHEKAREKLAASELVQKHSFVFLDRSLCFGAAALYHAIRVEGFCGPVVLTHCVAPRHVAYLSILLSDIQQCGRLLVFGAGQKRQIYEMYLQNLGITSQQCQIFSESYVDSSPTSELERATVVLATPHCSYSGINDIVDLAIAKDGDIDIFESLTSSETLQEPRLLIADQLMTLKYALQKPSVQLLIYEAHSILPAETTKIVEEVVNYTNHISAEKYVQLNPSHKKRKKEKHVEKHEEHDDVESDYSDIQIPNSDLFEIAKVSDIYKDQKVGNLINDGCYLAVIKRKQMMQFDSIFMIQYAESKGLFGSAQKADNQRLSALKERPKVRRKSTKKQSLNLERISSNTQASLNKKRKQSEVCPRVSQRELREKEMISSQIPRKTPDHRGIVFKNREKRERCSGDFEDVLLEEREENKKRRKILDETDL